MEFERTRISDVVLIRPRVYGDSRGFFLESWEKQKFAAGGVDVNFVQDNHSRSARNVLRGLHYQLPNAQGKLVRVARGAAFDVVVDIRRSSPTFGQWVGVELSDSNHHMLWVPVGFAHGYLTLSESADFIYRCTSYYSPPDERSIRWNDPEIGVEWPLPPGVEPVLSAKDAVAGSFRDAQVFP